MTQSNPRTWRGELLRAGLPLVILGLGVLVYRVSGSLKPLPERVTEVVRTPTVEVAPIQSFTGYIPIRVDGTVVPYREVVLAAEVAGKVIQRSVDSRAGHYVTKGTVLCEIDRQDYELEVSRLKEEIRQAELQVEQVDVDVANTAELIRLGKQDVALQEREVARLQKLVQSGTITASDLDRAKQGEIASRNGLQSAENRLRMLQSQRRTLQQMITLTHTRLTLAELNLSRTRIVAPNDGMIVEEMVEVDSFVQRGSPLFRIEDVSAAEVRCRLPAADWLWIWQDQRAPNGAAASNAIDRTTYELPQVPARVTYRLNNQEFIWEGRLARYDGIGLDARTRTVPCRILVPDPRRVEVRSLAEESAGAALQPPPALTRGMFVSVELHISPRLPLLFIPREALQLGDVVWRVADNKLEIIKVRIARRMHDRVLLAEGSAYAPGDLIVTSPLAQPRNGEVVHVAKTGPDAPLSSRTIPTASSSPEVDDS